MDEGFLLKLVMYIVPVIMSITVHEFAHAWVAYKLGDDTAASMGRMTLNPIAHIDPFGTIILPIMCVMMGAPAFGWAKPVPFNPVRLTRSLRMKHSTMLVGLAGPAANFLLALLLAIAYKILTVYFFNLAQTDPEAAKSFLQHGGKAA
ncbi:MAG: site-2 protease family protein, partial [Myxococcota bacterium]